MKGFIYTAFASIGLLSSQAAMASHTYVTPAAQTPNIDFTGYVDVYKGQSLPGCSVVLSLRGPDNAGDGHAFSHTDVDKLTATITLSGGPLGLCANVEPDPVPAGDITYTSIDDDHGILTFNDVFIKTITPGDCRGDIIGYWDEPNQELTVYDPIPADDPLTAVCQLDGVLTPNTTVDFSAPGDTGH